MRHFILTLITFIVCTSFAIAQEESVNDSVATTTEAVKFAHVDREAIVMLMPEYTRAIESIKVMAEEYDKELEQMESEYTTKYDAYIASRDATTPQIRKRRESELVAIQQNMADFTEVARKEMAQVERKAIAAVYNKATNMVEAIGHEYEYTYIFDTSMGKHTLSLLAYLGEASTDITPLVMELLGITPPAAEGEAAVTTEE